RGACDQDVVSVISTMRLTAAWRWSCRIPRPDEHADLAARHLELELRQGRLVGAWVALRHPSEGDRGGLHRPVEAVWGLRGHRLAAILASPLRYRWSRMSEQAHPPGLTRAEAARRLHDLGLPEPLSSRSVASIVAGNVFTLFNA